MRCWRGCACSLKLGCRATLKPRRTPKMRTPTFAQIGARYGYFDLLTSAFRSRLRLFHFFCHFRFDRLKIEAGALLHRGVFKEGLERLAHYLLDKYEAPELVLEPIKVLLGTFLGAIVGPAGSLERVQPQVGDIGNVDLRLFPKPAIGLVDESELIVVNAHSANRAFAEIEDFVTC